MAKVNALDAADAHIDATSPQATISSAYHNAERDATSLLSDQPGVSFSIPDSLDKWWLLGWIVQRGT